MTTYMYMQMIKMFMILINNSPTSKATQFNPVQLFLTF